MSASEEKFSNNVVSIGAADAESIRANLRELRDQIVTAWQERCVVLSKDEQTVLRTEIEETCKLLMDLTRHA